MRLVKITEKIIVNESSSIVFDYTQDYKNRLAWDTFLKKAELMDGAVKADKSVKAYCVARNGFGMVTEYITFSRPTVTAVRMTKGPYFFKSFLGSWNFRELSSKMTEVTFLYSFGLRFPFNLLGYFIKRNLQKNVRQRLIDLKKSVEKPSGYKEGYHNEG
jgi:ribosome-associated toxin RatA of RatAB toxin-antitoxin module